MKLNFHFRLKDLEGNEMDCYNAGSPDSLLVQFNSAGDLYCCTGGGSVRIGSGSPSSKLDVAGDIEISSGNSYYYGDPNTDSTWRSLRSGNDLIFQRRESTFYVTKSTISA